MRYDDDMIDAGQLLPKLLDGESTNSRLCEVAIKLAFVRAAGEGMRPHAVPLRLNSKTLLVSVTDIIWQKQLQSFGAELVHRINKLIGRDAVDFIEFRIDPATVFRAQGNERSRREPERKIRRAVPPELMAASESIADKELRDLFLRAAGNYIELRERKQKQ